MPKQFLSVIQVLLFNCMLFQSSCAICVDNDITGANGNEIPVCEEALQYLGVASVCFGSNANLCCDTCRSVALPNQTLIAEGFFIVDFKAFEQYLKEENGDAKKATDSLLQDIHFFITEVNNIYDSLKPYGLDIEVRILGVQILDYEWVSEEEDHIAMASQSSLMSHALNFFQTRPLNRTPEDYDFAVLLTGYDLVGSIGVAGFAALGAICSSYKIAVVTFEGAMSDSVKIAHEIGHLLGASHDPDNSKHVMNIVVDTGGRDLDRYTFSSQTASDIIKLMTTTTTGTSCLLNTSESSILPNISSLTY